MCLIVFAHDCHPRYRLVLAANRDEYYDRPTAAAAFWPENKNILAGRDLLLGGTWLGLNRKGRIAALTNYRDPSRRLLSARSRGELVSDFLLGTLPPRSYLTDVHKKSGLYNGFSLLVGDIHSLWYYSNIEKAARQVAPGIHGLSNHLLDTPWPKVTKARDSLAAILESSNIGAGPLFALLSDNAPAPDEMLPSTGVGLTWERILSPIFIKSPTYGTRSSTVILIDRNNRVSFSERTFIPGREGHEITFEFTLA